MRLILPILILSLLSACGVTPTAPTVTPTITVTASPIPPSATPTETLTPTAEPIKIGEVFNGSSTSFLRNLIKLGGEDVVNNFVIENGKSFLVMDGKKYEVDSTSGAYNKDIKGNELQVIDTANPDFITFKGAGESEGKVFSYNSGFEYEMITNQETGEKKTVTVEPHFFEVIQPSQYVDLDAPVVEQDKQLEQAIKNRVRISLDQVKNGDWARSVFLSGYVRPYPENQEIAQYPYALYHNANTEEFGDLSLLYTPLKTPLPFYAIVDVGEKDVGVQPYSTVNPSDLENPNRKEMTIFNTVVGEETLKSGHEVEIMLQAFREPDRLPANLIVSNPSHAAVSGYNNWNWPNPSLAALDEVEGVRPIEFGQIQDAINYAKNNLPDQNLWQVEWHVQIDSQVFQIMFFTFY